MKKEKQDDQPGELINQSDSEGDSSVKTRVSIAQLTKLEFSGPIPSPELLERYEKAYPGTVDWILGAAEDERKHRHREKSREGRARDFGIFFTVVGMSHYQCT